MTRVVSLFFPTWATDRLRRLEPTLPPETPLVLVGRDGRRRVVLAADSAAQSCGIRVGMAAAQAQALVAGLDIRDADPAGDRAALERLALWALRFSPVVAADPPDGLVIDTTGADHLFGGEGPMLETIARRIAAAGYGVRAALAGTWGAAHGLARYGAKSLIIVPEHATARAAASLPLAALRLAPATVAGLKVLGFRSVGELAGQPRAPLVLRFGPEVALRLDQAFGRVEEPIVPVRDPDQIRARRAFAEPIAAPETIAKYVGKLATELCDGLEKRGLGVRRVHLRIDRVDRSAQATHVGLALPMRDAARLTRLLCETIARLDPGFGIEILTLSATATDPLDARQTISSLAAPPKPDVSGLIDTLLNRTETKSIHRATPVQSDVPERSVRRIGPLSPETGETWAQPWPRPTRLLAHPEPIDAMALLPDHPPVAFTWRGVRRRVKAGDGPERVFGEWWKCSAELVAVRDYFRVEDDGGERFWIFRAGDGEDAATGSHRWFLHGIFG